MTKLDLYDQVDDVTGLFNARYFVQGTDLEMARARRYRSVFAVVGARRPRRAARAASDGGPEPGSSASSVASCATACVRSTAWSTAAKATVTAWPRSFPRPGRRARESSPGRLATRVAGFLAARGVEVDVGALDTRALTYPEDEALVEALRREFATIDHVEHPEASAPISAP